MILDVNGNELDAVFLNSAGTETDRFRIVHGADVSPPTLAGATAPGPTQVEVLFSDKVQAVGAGNAANYDIDGGVTVQSATLQADERTVVLQPTSLSTGVPYLLTVNNILDDADNPIAADTTAIFDYKALQTVDFQDGHLPTTAYAGTRDTELHSETADVAINYGGATVLNVDGSEPSGSVYDASVLITWDVAAISSEAIVEAASLTLRVTNPSSSTYEIFQVLRPLEEFEATWNGPESGVDWATPGAHALTVDRGAQVLGTINAGGTGNYVVTLNADGHAVVQGWIEGTLANQGLILDNPSASDGLDFKSSDNATATERPKLTVIYTIPDPGDVTPPSTPDGLTVTATTENSVSHAWNTASDDTGVESYEIYRDGAMVAMTAATSFVNGGLAPGTTYLYEVGAMDAAGNQSPLSDPVQPTTDSPPAERHGGRHRHGHPRCRAEVPRRRCHRDLTVGRFLTTAGRRGRSLRQLGRPRQRQRTGHDARRRHGRSKFSQSERQFEW